MYRKKRFLSVIIIIVLLLSVFPSITSQSFNVKSRETALSQSANIQNTKNIEDIQLNIILKKSNGEVEKIFKKINSSELKNIKSNLVKIMKSDLGYMEKFKCVLEELKQNNLILNNLQLKDIISFPEFDNNTLKFNNVTNKNFVAHFAPIIVVGGGFGLGLGYQVKSLVNSFSHFFAVVGGLAYVLCLDSLNSTVYQLISFLMPIFVGYIGGYTGIIIFAVVPGIFYSNLVMIGFAPFTCWFSFPEAQ